VTADRDHDVVVWLEKLDATAKADVQQLINLVVAGDSRLQQAIRWGRLTFTVEGNWHHWLCAIAVTRKGTKLVFHKGALLQDPQGMLEGSGSYLRDLPLARAKDAPEAVTALVRSAVSHQTDMRG
jgi:hypothetical protein